MAGPDSWVFYDTDGAGGFDLVLHSGEQRSGRAERAWRLGPDGALVAEPALAGGALFRPSLFRRRADQAALGRLAALLLEPRFVGR